MLFETKEDFHEVVKKYKADELLMQTIEKLRCYLMQTDNTTTL
jgi:hypothetical protein